MNNLDERKSENELGEEKEICIQNFGKALDDLNYHKIFIAGG